MAERPGRRTNARYVQHRLTAASLGILLALLLAELALRLGGSSAVRAWRPQLASRLPLSLDSRAVDDLAARRSILMLDPDLGWVTTPGRRAENAGWHQQHNRAGLRADAEYTPTPRAGMRRFAAYGDSFTYCTDVNLSECWTQRLAELLLNTEVLNFGVPGYGSDQAWLRYQHKGASWQPCAVLIGHYVGSGERVINRFRPFAAPGMGSLPKPRYLRDGDHLVLLPSPVTHPDELKDPAWVEANLGPHDAWYFPGVFVANPFDGLELVTLIRTASYQAARQRVADSLDRPGSEALAVLAAVLAGFAEQVRADGATPVVLILPGDAEIAIARDGRARSYTPLLEALEQRAIPTIDLVDVLGEQARLHRLAELIQGHYRPLGNSVVAHTLADTLPRLTAETCERPR